MLTITATFDGEMNIKCTWIILSFTISITRYQGLILIQCADENYQINFNQFSNRRISNNSSSIRVGPARKLSNCIMPVTMTIKQRSLAFDQQSLQFHLSPDTLTFHRFSIWLMFSSRSQFVALHRHLASKVVAIWRRGA